MFIHCSVGCRKRTKHLCKNLRLVINGGVICIHAYTHSLEFMCPSAEATGILPELCSLFRPLLRVEKFCCVYMMRWPWVKFESLYCCCCSLPNGRSAARSERMEIAINLVLFSLHKLVNNLPEPTQLPTPSQRPQDK